MTSEPIHLVATFTLKSGKVDEFLEAARNIAVDVHEKELGIDRYYAIKTKSADGKDQVIFIEKYQNHAAVEAHMVAPHFQAFAQLIPDLLDQPFEIKQGALALGYENLVKV